MTLAEQIADDYQYIDGVEEVSLTPQHPVAAAVSAIKALRGPLGHTAMQLLSGTIGFTGTEITFHLWRSTLQGTVPKIGDKITDGDGTVYTILSLSLETLRTRWRAVCRQDV